MPQRGGQGRGCEREAGGEEAEAPPSRPCANAPVGSASPAFGGALWPRSGWGLAGAPGPLKGAAAAWSAYEAARADGRAGRGLAQVCLGFAAPPTTSVRAARWALAGYLGAFFLAFNRASAREGLGPAHGVVVFQLGMTAFLYTCWLRSEGLARRAYWWLDRARRREWAAVWAALADLLPDSVARDLCAAPAAPAPARRRPALVLFADLVRRRGVGCAAWAAWALAHGWRGAWVAWCVRCVPQVGCGPDMACQGHTPRSPGVPHGMSPGMPRSPGVPPGMSPGMPRSPGVPPGMSPSSRASPRHTPLHARRPGVDAAPRR